MSSSIGGYPSLRGPTGAQAGDRIPKGYKLGQLQRFTPEQMDLFQSLFSNVSPDSFLSRLSGGDQSGFDEAEAPALRQFSELQGNIASRFSGMGSGARRSSGFQNTMNQASSNFASELSSRRQDLQRQALRDLMDISGSLLNTNPTDRFLVEQQKQPSFLERLLGGVSGGVGNLLGNAAGFHGSKLLGMR